MHRDEGSALVEFALIVPILVILVFGIVEFGRAYNASVTLTHATREGVRELAITRDPSSAAAVTRDAAASLDPLQITVIASPCVPGERTQIETTYPFQYSLPLIGSGTFTLRSTAVMRCGG